MYDREGCEYQTMRNSSEIVDTSTLLRISLPLLLTCAISTIATSCCKRQYCCPNCKLQFAVLPVVCRHKDCGQLAQLSPAAAEQLRIACTQALTQSYADGVEALVFSQPEQGSAAEAASAEAAAKIKANRDAIVDDILEKSGIARRGRRSGTTYGERWNRFDTRVARWWAVGCACAASGCCGRGS
jgi:hypothetical protein